VSGYHVLLSSWWHATGVSEERPSPLAHPGHPFGALAFLLGLLLFAEERAGLWAALLLAAYPLHVKFSTGTSLELTSVFFQLLMFCLFALHLREASTWTGFATLAAAAYYVLVRPENLLIGIRWRSL